MSHLAAKAFARQDRCRIMIPVQNYRFPTYLAQFDRDITTPTVLATPGMKFKLKWSLPNARALCISALALGTCLLFLVNGCATRQAATKPSIEFSVIPPAAEGGPDKSAPIAGRVTGARAGQQIVLFAKAGIWWVQPTNDEPFTAIQPDSTWTTSIHLGTEYAALLVEAGYRPPPTLDVLPSEGGDVIAVKIVPGEKSEQG